MIKKQEFSLQTHPPHLGHLCAKFDDHYTNQKLVGS